LIRRASLPQERQSIADPGSLDDSAGRQVAPDPHPAAVTETAARTAVSATRTRKVISSYGGRGLPASTSSTSKRIGRSSWS
jgi:hypothetical protein